MTNPQLTESLLAVIRSLPSEDRQWLFRQLEQDRQHRTRPWRPGPDGHGRRGFWRLGRGTRALQLLGWRSDPRRLMLHRYGDGLLAFISSNVSEAPGRDELDIPAENPDVTATGLRVSSRMRLSRMTTLAISLVKRRIGVLPTALQVECEEVLSRVICGQS